MPRPKEPDHIVHKDKDLRIADANPWDLARKIMQGGAPKREESDADDEGDD
ncbi:MAG: hypothetical protein OXC69_07850 [Candidatus Tectomicrobia bacterium]|nr:hypothetical protein [Candidatus Tectomicrobia bacterium]